MTELKDPLNNRKVKECPSPFQRSLTDKQLFKANGGVNINELKDFLKR